MYDSIYNFANDYLQAQVASTLHTDYKQINLINVIKQSGSSDCGLFAIAHATALALGELRPELYHFNREHFN